MLFNCTIRHYEGGYLDGIYNGRGILVSDENIEMRLIEQSPNLRFVKTIMRYKGEFKNGEPNGKGMLWRYDKDGL